MQESPLSSEFTGQYSGHQGSIDSEAMTGVAEVLAVLSDRAEGPSVDEKSLKPVGEATFEHKPSTTWVLGLFLSVALVVAWQLARLPLGSSGNALTALALIAVGFLGFRLWLTGQSVVMDETGFEVRLASRRRRIEFKDIRKIRFDHVSHDLLVETAGKTERIARSLQGHRVIRQRVQAALIPEATSVVEPAADLTVDTRLLPRIAATFALCCMAMCVSAIWSLDPSLGMLNFAGMMLPTYVLFDRCILRHYRFDGRGMEIRGLRRARFHARGELVQATIRKGALSSTLRLQFVTEMVELHEYLVGQSIVEISEFVETCWSVRVSPEGAASGSQPGQPTDLT